LNTTVTGTLPSLRRRGRLSLHVIRTSYSSAPSTG
jgi:hypothetical protein